MEDLKQSLAESCESLKLCRIRAAYFVQDREKQLHADDVLKCYEFFEWLTEQLFDVVTSAFLRYQIEEKLQISVHVVCVCQEDIRIYLAIEVGTLDTAGGGAGMVYSMSGSLESSIILQNIIMFIMEICLILELILLIFRIMSLVEKRRYW